MKTIENLWPEDIGSSNITMPKEILIQQANYLTDMTKNVVNVEIKTNQGVLASSEEKIMVHEFIIKAPSMGNYKFTLMRVMHNFAIYPIRVFNALTDDFVDANTEEEFIQSLGTVFRNEKTTNAINSIIAQTI